MTEDMTADKNDWRYKWQFQNINDMKTLVGEYTQEISHK